MNPWKRSESGPAGVVARVVTWAPAALAAAFLITLVVCQSSIRESLNSQADFASAPMIAQLLPQAPAHSITTLGDYAWYEALWLLIGTKWLPHHFFVWQMVPFAIWFATAALAALSAGRVAGRAAGIVAGAMVICGGLVFRSTLWSLNTHGPLVLHVMLVECALLVAVARPAWVRGLRGVLPAVVLGLVSGLGATDPLMAPVGLGALLLAALLVWVRRGIERPFTLALGTAVVAVIFSRVLISAAHHAHITWTMHQVLLANGNQIVDNVGTAFTALVAIVANDPIGQPIIAPRAIAMAGGIVALLTTGFVMRAAVRPIVTELAPLVERLRVHEHARRAGVDDTAVADGVSSPGGGGAAERDAEPDPGAPSALWLAIVGFWVVVVIVNLLAWILTDSAVSELSGRYLCSAWVGMCVLLPVVAQRYGHGLLASGVATVICAVALYGFIQAPEPGAGRGYPSTGIASGIRKLAAENHVTRGYGGFWDAIPISWHTRFATKLYPIEPCMTGKGNCPFYEHQISSWYDPQAGPSMLVTDTSQPLQPQVDTRYGAPIVVRHWGSYSIYVYDHDIAPYIGG